MKKGESMSLLLFVVRPWPVWLSQMDFKNTMKKDILCYTDDDSYGRMWPDVRYVKVNLQL